MSEPADRIVASQSDAAASVTSVAQRILGMISSGEVAPGDRLPSERQLAQEIGVGRSTIREAFATLDLLGLVETRHGAGTFISGKSSDLLPQAIEWGLLLGRPRAQDLVEARSQLETVTVQLAAARATADDITRLEVRLDEMRAASHDHDRFVDADVAFHLDIADIAGNSVLADILQSIRSLLEVWIRRASSGSQQVEVTLIEHARIVDAISTGSADMAKGAMLHHMKGAEVRLSASLAGDTAETG